jgi:hypothetical protein
LSIFFIKTLTEAKTCYYVNAKLLKKISTSRILLCKCQMQIENVQYSTT